MIFFDGDTEGAGGGAVYSSHREVFFQSSRQTTRWVPIRLGPAAVSAIGIKNGNQALKVAFRVYGKIKEIRTG